MVKNYLLLLLMTATMKRHDYRLGLVASCVERGTGALAQLLQELMYLL